MRSVGYYSLISGCAVVALLLSGCDGGGACGESSTATTCPPEVSAYAQVNGRALRSDGSPVVGNQAYVSCGDGAGASNGGTDAAGNFAVHLEYAVVDTLLDPYPPREADGSFVISCQAYLQLLPDVLLLNDQLPVRFAATPSSVVPTVVELRETGP